MTYTKGPWKLDSEESPLMVWATNPDGSEVTVADCDMDNFMDVCEANARLIAAAPKMFDALKAIVRDFEICDRCRHADCESIRSAVAVISEAEGK